MRQIIKIVLTKIVTSSICICHSEAFMRIRLNLLWMANWHVKLYQVTAYYTTYIGNLCEPQTGTWNDFQI